MKKSSKNKGFTLIEILVVIGIIAILATIVLIAINPARQFAQARDTQRTSNLNAILNAVGQKIADCKGIFDASTTACPVPSGTACATLPIGSGNEKTIGTGGTEINLGACLVPTYMPSLPADPTIGTTTSTGYKIYQESAGGRVHVLAETPEPNIPRTIDLEIIR